MRNRRPDRTPLKAALVSLLFPALVLGVESTVPSLDPSGRPTLLEALATEPLVSRAGVVVSSSEAASRAGARILEAGGNAVDAAVATAFALSATDPSESGLGGESWILIHRGNGTPVAVVCPARVPMRVDVAALRRARDTIGVSGHLAAATPTTVAALAHALSRYGTRSLAEVLAPAIEEAERGWDLGWPEASVVRHNARKLALSPLLGPILLPGACGPDGIPLPAAPGTRLRLPGLAGTLRRLSEAGAADFYSGRIASQIDADMRANGGFVRKDDLARVPRSVVEIEPVRTRYRDREVLSIGAPGNGDLLIEALQILESFPGELVGGSSADAHQLLVEAVRIAREDSRAWAPVIRSWSAPGTSARLDPSHAARRAREIRPGTAWNPAEIGPRAEAPRAGTGNTTQISVIDRAGNGVSITQTLGADWGACAAGEGLGFPYNGVLAWFDLDRPDGPASPLPYAFLPATAAPTIVLRDGAVEIVLGSPGSSRIVPAILSVIRNVVDGGMGLAEAVAAPRVLWQDEGPQRRLIAEALPPVTHAVLDQLRKRGYGDIWVLGEPGEGLQSFGCVNAAGWNRAGGFWEGVGDPRRRGVAAAPVRVPSPGR